jgi:hypothetical protein
MLAPQTGPLAAPIAMYRDNLAAWLLAAEAARAAAPLAALHPQHDAPVPTPRPGGPARPQPTTPAPGGTVRGPALPGRPKPSH